MIHYERGAWSDVCQTARRVGLAEEDVGDAYHGALGWARTSSLGATANHTPRI
ncbi:MAG: hypothetical protein ACRD2N_04305 [Vicinamibacterales bacterium]